MDTPLIIGQSASLQKLLSFISHAAHSDSNVLIHGETGVGKDLAAKAIHCQSCRRAGPFVKVNCANLNESLFESELFGYKKGAFTGAFINKPGLIETANGGTFFFDEIGDLGLNLQAKLLQAIEDKEIRRLGDSFARSIDARFIFASNRNLFSLVTRGKFRNDLFYRIGILIVHIPPLRERREDIPLLVEAVLAEESQKRGVCLAISKDAMKKMCAYSFPGNVRELENLLIRAAELSAHTTLAESDFSFDLAENRGATDKRRNCQMKELVNALIKCNGNKTKAAKELGVSRVHLYRLLNSVKDDSLTRDDRKA